jgi:hypothetical protein
MLNEAQRTVQSLYPFSTSRFRKTGQDPYASWKPLPGMKLETGATLWFSWNAPRSFLKQSFKPNIEIVTSPPPKKNHGDYTHKHRKWLWRKATTSHSGCRKSLSWSWCRSIDPIAKPAMNRQSVRHDLPTPPASGCIQPYSASTIYPFHPRRKEQ